MKKIQDIKNYEGLFEFELQEMIKRSKRYQEEKSEYNFLMLQFSVARINILLR